MRQWLEGAGLDLDRVADLPGKGGDKLTVTLWLGKDRRVALAGAGAREVA
jgi:ArsR family transcriptional regulator